jgi:hypothetical protein
VLHVCQFVDSVRDRIFFPVISSWIFTPATLIYLHGATNSSELLGFMTFSPPEKIHMTNLLPREGAKTIPIPIMSNRPIQKWSIVSYAPV